MNDFQLFFRLGLDHILSIDSIDHILFLMALLLVFTFRNWRQLLWLVSLFTMAHSISLFLSVYGIVIFDNNLIEQLIFVTIIITALSNLIIKQEFVLHKTHLYFSFFFGLIHGLGFAKDFNMIAVGEKNKLFPLFSFAIGIETAQIILGLMILVSVKLLSKVLRCNKHDIIWLISGGITGYILALLN